MFPNFRLVMAALVCTLGVAVAFAFVSVRVAHDTVVPRPTQPPSVFQQTLLSAGDISFSSMAFNQPAPVISAIPYAQEPHPADPGFAIASDPQTPASTAAKADLQDRADSAVAPVSGKAEVTVAAVAPGAIEPPLAQTVTAPVVDPLPAAPVMPAPVAETPAESIATTGPQTKVAAVEQGSAKTDGLKTDNVKTDNLAQPENPVRPIVTSLPATAPESETQNAEKDTSKDAASGALQEPTPIAQAEPAQVVVARVPDDVPQTGKTTTGNDQDMVQGTGQETGQEAGQSSVVTDTRPLHLPTPNPKFAALMNAGAPDRPAAKSSRAAKAKKSANAARAKSQSTKPAKPRAASKPSAKKVKKRVVVVRRRQAPAPAAQPAAPAANTPFSLFGN